MQPGFSLFYRRRPSSTEWANPPTRESLHIERFVGNQQPYSSQNILGGFTCKAGMTVPGVLRSSSTSTKVLHHLRGPNFDWKIFILAISQKQWGIANDITNEDKNLGWFEELVCKGEALNSRLHRLFGLLRILSVSQGFGPCHTAELVSSSIKNCTKSSNWARQ